MRKRTDLDIAHCRKRYAHSETARGLVIASGPRAGERPGYVNSLGYRRITVRNREWLEHVVVLAMRDGFVSPMIIDHINHDKTDNRPENLRFVTPRENMKNIRPGAQLIADGRPNSQHLHRFRRVTETECSLRGVRWKNDVHNWTAAICDGGPQIHLGSFPSLQEAAAAYDAAAARIVLGLSARP